MGHFTDVRTWEFRASEEAVSGKAVG